jgi:cell wall-associated NlpC family hydrolase
MSVRRAAALGHGLLALALLAACGQAPVKETPAYPTGPRIDLANSALVRQELYTQYRQWKGARYEVGGLSRRGIDCSGFMYVTFKSKLGIVLPRSTELQAQSGEAVSRSALRTGDLVFFKTGIFIRHVGVYLERGRFLHASTSHGVMISELGDAYWKSRYWKARRIAS